MKYIILILLILSNINASSIEELYSKAKKEEKNNELEKALMTYKEIDKKEREYKSIYVDEKIKKDLELFEPSIKEIEDKDTKQTIEQIVASKFDLYPYKENYLFPFSYSNSEIEGRKRLETKFQISVKKPIISNLMNMDETIYFGYTQTSWWQLYTYSSPFRETNYKPEVFVDFPFISKDQKFRTPLRIGLLHESNGQPDGVSRSWNRVYVSSILSYKNWLLIPQVWLRIPEPKRTDDNPDILDYYGYGDITIAYPYKSHTFKLTLRNNLKLHDNKGFAQFDWTFPLLSSKTTFGYLQISSGYGDSLIDYDKNVNKISFGISLSR